jgi:hypothetical protein
MRRALLFAALPLTGLMTIGCTVENLCDDYVNYMCDCHDGGTDQYGEAVDCSEYQTVYENADQDLQLECQDELDAQIDYDADQGTECEA